MKNTTRILLGLLASLFLSVGFLRAAEFVAPVSASSNALHADTAPNCVWPCSFPNE